MNKLLVILCITALLINSVFIIIFPDEFTIEWDDGDDDDDQHVITEIRNVTVPLLNHGDIANYVDEVFGEMYWINYTTGNWTRITLNMNGVLIKNILNQEDHEDGFGIVHKAVPHSEYIDASIMLRYQDHEGEDIVINGRAEISRLDYRDLYENKIIKSVTDGLVTVDQTLQEFIEGGITYEGTLRSYPNVNEEVEETLDELIYGNQQEIKLNQSGNITKALYNEDEGYLGFYNTVYHWKADKTERINGYNTMRINISASFGQSEFQLPLLRQIWISNDVSQPVKLYTRTNQSAADENGRFYFILENTVTLNEKGFSRGDVEIAWESCQSEHYAQKHPAGEYMSWNYLPQAGSQFGASSFEFNPNEAVSIAMDQSPNFKEFMESNRDKIVIDYAQYNSTHDPSDITLTGSHRWLFVFGYKLTWEEWEYYRENDISPKARYALQVTYNTSKFGLDDTKEVEKDYGLLNWSTELSKDDISNKLLTVAAGEKILKSDTEVKEMICTNPLTPDKIYWDDPLGQAQCFLGQGITSESLPSMGIIETITGFTIPTSKLSWIVQKGRLYDSSGDTSDTFAAAVDAETGQMQYVLEIQGTSLFQLFG
ncbi:MAG: hypothetical protein JSV49_07245 [Thermoplasmata archaeon]|nr:MAG: hypothetical protein JSV49_07245 [Thermoplasmata archaeon]